MSQAKLLVVVDRRHCALKTKVKVLPIRGHTESERKKEKGQTGSITGML